jgi:release factor glutamine methyltransferase
MTTTRELLEEGIRRLREADMETPRLDAEVLLAHALNVDRTTIVAHQDALVGDGAAASFRATVERRAAGEPVAYLRGLKEFHGIALAADARALIPRPETEQLVDLGVAEVMRRLTSGARPDGSPEIRVLDVGTGSGAIAVALAVALRDRRVPLDDVTVTALDISADALELARENAVGQAVGDRLRFVLADLVPPTDDMPWDIVLANLPYVRSDALAALGAPTSFEPALALDGGPDGLDVIRRLVDLLPRVLDPGGVAMLEIGADQRDAIEALAAGQLPGWTCGVEVDLSGLPRVAILRPVRSA